jgi:hypothetical protein
MTDVIASHWESDRFRGQLSVRKTSATRVKVHAYDIH